MNCDEKKEGRSQNGQKSRLVSVAFGGEYEALSSRISVLEKNIGVLGTGLFVAYPAGMT